MKRLLLLSGCLIVFMAIVGGSCKPKTTPVEMPPKDTTSTQPAEPVQPDTPPKPEVKQINESDFMVVYFDFDKADVRSDQAAALENNASILKDNMNVTVQIEGHCDERGTVEYNLALGDRRASSVKTYLINLGIAAERIQTVSYGKERPSMMGHDEDAWAKNRRAQFRVISQ